MNDAAQMFADALSAHSSARLEDMHVSIPGRIESYDREKQKATVQPMIKRVYFENGEQKSKSYPVFTDVPVEFFGGGGWSLTFPVPKGTTCRLQFCSAAIDRFLATGKEVDPGDGRRFSLSDAVCVLGLRDFAHALKDLPDDAWVMTAPTGKKILLGSINAVQSAILGDAFKTAHTTLINSIVTALNGLTPGAGGPVSTALTAFNNASWLASKVKVE